LLRKIVVRITVNRPSLRLEIDEVRRFMGQIKTKPGMTAQMVVFSLLFVSSLGFVFTML
jgi:hypothetical protein